MAKPEAPAASNSSAQNRKAQNGNTPDELTVLIFKDTSTARTFRIPMRWIHQFGWILLALALTTLLSVAIAIQMTVQMAVQSGQSVWKNRTAFVNSLTSTTETKQVKKPEVAVLDPHATETAPIVDPSLIAKTSPISARPYLFKGLPDQIQAPPSDASQVSVEIVSPEAHWVDKTLKVSFALQHEGATPGAQQGRILILARGPGAIMTHPDQILQSSDNDILIDPNKGEFFSVSRYREAKASFGPLPSRDLLTEVEVIIVGSKGEMLIHERITPSNGSAVEKTEAASSSQGQ